MDDHAAISMEEIIPGQFWEDLPPPPEPPLVIGDGLIDGVVTNGGEEEGSNAMDQNQSPSEWSFERLLEEELLTDATPLENLSSSAALHADTTVVEEVDLATMMAPAAVVSTVGGDPMEYNTILKRKLDEDLATVSMWRASSVVHPELSEGSNNYIGGNRNFLQNMRSISEGPIDRVRNVYVRARLATCSSSRDLSTSDDDDMDGEVEILGFKLPTEEKVRKRKEANRESARRSRYRKAAHLKEMEDQVAELKVENSSLLRRLTTLNQKYTDATVDNRVLKANMETLRAKVKMAEDALKRATGTSSSPFSRPAAALVPAIANADASGHILDSIIEYLMSSTDHATTDNNFEPRTTTTMTTTPSSFSQAPEKPPASSTNSAMINRIAAHHAVAVELLHKRLGGAMPAAASGVAPPPELAPPPSSDVVESTDMGMH